MKIYDKIKAKTLKSYSYLNSSYFKKINIDMIKTYLYSII